MGKGEKVDGQKVTQSVKCNIRSANGAKCNSQGQVQGNVRKAEWPNVTQSLKRNIRSANGAKCNSQEHVLSAAKHVAPGTPDTRVKSTESA